jgi:hypothetical protein
MVRAYAEFRPVDDEDNLVFIARTPDVKSAAFKLIHYPYNFRKPNVLFPPRDFSDALFNLFKFCHFSSIIIFGGICVSSWRDTTDSITQTRGIFKARFASLLLLPSQRLLGTRNRRLTWRDFLRIMGAV